MQNAPNNIREALDQGGFDWDSGKVYIVKPAGSGLVQVENNDPGLDMKGNYYALDKEFVYMSCLASILGRTGIFPARAPREVDIVEVDLDVFFGDDPIKGMVKEIVDGIEVFSVPDATKGKPIGGFNFHIVGSKDIPLFVISLTEKEAVQLFFTEVANIARQTMAIRAMESIILGEAVKKSKEDPEGTGN